MPVKKATKKIKSQVQLDAYGNPLVERVQALEEPASILAGYGRRLTAFIIDLAILWLVGCALSYPFRYQLSDLG
jgi:hypothetical protein